MTGLVKLALIRDTPDPIGQPGPLHLHCRCGQNLPVAAPFTAARLTCPTCGQAYDSRGYLLD